jgi:branched-chain amino acid transport system substrate-binding protein
MRGRLYRIVVAAAGAAMLAWSAPAGAQETIKVGLVLPITGPFAGIARQVEAGARAYMALHGDTVAGHRIELVVRDDGNVADQTKRLAQELVVNDGVAVLAGFGLTPLAFAAAPVATEAQVPMVVMAAATAVITQRSDYIVRTSFTLPQATEPMAQWAFENGITRVITLVSDYAPGNDAAAAFMGKFTALGGEVVEELKVPLANPDFSPFLQRVIDAQPEAVFVFVPAGQSALFMRQFEERGVAASGVRLIGTGDVTDDDVLDQIGQAAVGVINTHHYSAAHESPENEAFVAEMASANNGLRANFMGVGGYDGMHLIYAAIEATGGETDGDALLAAMKGLSWESPRGPVSIDPETRDIIQNIYVREVQERDGHLWNVEIQTYEQLKDPFKAAQ